MKQSRWCPRSRDPPKTSEIRRFATFYTIVPIDAVSGRP
jgi:hypothetical protein